MQRVNPAAPAMGLTGAGVGAAPPPAVAEAPPKKKTRRAHRYDGAYYVRPQPSAKHDLRRQLEAELGKKLSGRQFRLERKRRARGGE